MIQIPSSGQFLKQLNIGNALGSIWSSFNLNLVQNLGRIRTTRMIRTTVSTTNTDLGCPVAFKSFKVSTLKWWTVAGAKVHNASNSQSNFVADGTASSPTTCSSDTADMEIFNGSLYVTSQTGINKLTSGGTWTTNGTAINTNTPHLMTSYADRLYVTDLFSKIYSLDTSDTVATTGSYTLSFTESLSNVITVLRTASNRIWVGTLNTLGGKGAMYEWDGQATQASRSYRMQSAGPLSCVIKDDVPWVMDANGALLQWNGGTFIEKARLPIPPGSLLLTKATTSTLNDRFIHPNGMTLVDGRINILVNNLYGDSAGTIEENLPSGVWEYDEQIGLYHKYSVSYTPVNSTTVTDYGQNRISRAGAITDAKITNATSTANGYILAGASYYSDASTEAHGVFIDDTLDTTQKYGYLVTPWIASAALRDTWQVLYLKYRRLLDSADKIVCKYRTYEQSPSEISIAWATPSSFTTTTDIRGKEGYEVEVIQGAGSGKTAHISTITRSGSTYTAALDDSFTNVSGTAKARLQSWIKLSETSEQANESFRYPIGVVAERIQLKVCMQFTGKDEIHLLTVINKPHEEMV